MRTLKHPVVIAYSTGIGRAYVTQADTLSESPGDARRYDTVSAARNDMGIYNQHLDAYPGILHFDVVLLDL